MFYVPTVNFNPISTGSVVMKHASPTSKNPGEHVYSYSLIKY